MKIEFETRYIVCVEGTAYFAGWHDKYADVWNMNFRKYAYCFADEESAEKRAAFMRKGAYTDAKVEEVYSNYCGLWKGGCCILGEAYDECQLNLQSTTRLLMKAESKFVERKNGEWKYEEFPDTGQISTAVKCPFCERIDVIYIWQEANETREAFSKKEDKNFCPKCGAKLHK